MSSTPPTEEPAPRLPLIIVSLVLALVPVQLDGLVAATAVPTIAGDLGGFDRIAWIATAFLLTMAIGTVLAGRLGDMFGRRAMLLAALGTFFVGSLGSGISTSMGELVASRAVQGLGAGMTFTTLLAVIADVVPPERRSRVMGLMGAIAPVSMIIGPWVGGVITEHLGWRWIFLLNLPLVALSIIGAATLLHLPVRARGGRIDVAGLLAVSVASSGVVLAVTWGGHQYAWTSWHVLGAALVAAVAVVVLVVVERRAQHPVLPPSLFRNRAVVSSFVVVFLGTGAIMLGTMNYLPLYLQLVQGRSASSSGLLLLPMLLPAIGTAVATGAWTSRPERFRTAMVAGTALLAGGSALMATMDAGTSAWVTAAFMVVVGVGVGLLFQTPTVLVQNNAAADEVGAATGAAGFMRMIGGAVGVGAFGALFSSTLSGYVADHVPAGQAQPDVTALTPDALAALPAVVRSVVSGAVVAGSSALFWAATAAGLLAVVAAICVPRRPSAPADAVDDAVAQDVVDETVRVDM